MNNRENDQKQILFKMSVIGDSNVGKSCLMNKYTKDEYKIDHSITIGVEFTSKQLQIDGTLIKLQIWDTAGQETFRSIVSSFYRNAQAIFLIYDITNKNSFKRLEYWFKEASQYCSRQTVYALIGNKVDNEEQREVEQEEVDEFMKNNRIEICYETSAKTGHNVKLAFEEVARQVLQIYDSSQMMYYQDNVVKLLDDVNQSQAQQNHCIKPCSC